MMRIAVTGSMGQVATSLVDQAGPEFEIVLLGRRVFLLEDRGAVLAGLKAARPDAVINAAAYTAVDRAEAEEDLALAVNGEGAGHVAEAADRIGAPLLQLSTDYVFDGALDRPYREDDPPGPRSAYGRSKLLGERLVAERCANNVILRTAWVFSPYGAEFRPHDAFGSTRRATRSRSSPTSAAIPPRPSTSPQPCSPSPRERTRIPRRRCAAFST